MTNEPRDFLFINMGRFLCEYSHTMAFCFLQGFKISRLCFPVRNFLTYLLLLLNNEGFTSTSLI